ncbi:MAG: hypothetical protein LBC71_08360 [Oscillospiraceae bacterium]|nr:hypothetical protein [Oscillospiraceae bacterium]
MYDWYIQSIDKAIRFGITGEWYWTDNNPNLFISLFFTGPIIWRVLPIVSLILFFMFFFKKLHYSKYRINVCEYATKKEMMLFGFLIVALSSWHQYYPMFCPSHAYWATGLMFGILVYAILLFLKKFKLNNIIAIILTMLIVLTPLLPNQIPRRVNTSLSVLEMNKKEFVKIDYGFHLNGIRTSQEVYEFYLDYFSYIEFLNMSFPDKQFLNYSKYPLLAITFPTNITNMTMFGSSWFYVYRDFGDKLELLVDEFKPILVTDREILRNSYNFYDYFGNYVLIYENESTLIYADTQTANLLQQFPE